MLEAEFQKIYDSEINVEIRWMWDAGIVVKLGDEMNGYKAEENVTSLSEVVPWLQKAISKHHPTSRYNLARRRSAERFPMARSDPLFTGSDWRGDARAEKRPQRGD